MKIETKFFHNADEAQAFFESTENAFSIGTTSKNYRDRGMWVVSVEVNEADQVEPAKQYANHYGYSDVTPYEVVKTISEKTIEVRRMKYELLNKDELKFHAGGFAANCSNQRDQKYSFDSDPDESIVRLRLRKDGCFYDKWGNKFRLNDKPIRFYDYNF